MRVALASSFLCLVAYLQLASAAVLPRGQQHPSTQVTACRNVLRYEVAFCKLWLHGQTPPRSTVATATTTKLVQGPPVRVTTTPSITKTQTASSILPLTATTQTTTTLEVEVATTITSTSISTSTVDEATATETQTLDFHEIPNSDARRRRSNGVTKLKAVQQYSNDVITEACEYILYGTNGLTRTLTSTSTQAARCESIALARDTELEGSTLLTPTILTVSFPALTVTARPSKTTITSTQTIPSTVSTETDVSTIISATGISTLTSVVDSVTTVTQTIDSTTTVSVPEPTADQSCNNQGINWAYYSDPTLENKYLATIDPTEDYQNVKTSQPQASGTAIDFQSYSFVSDYNPSFQPYNGPSESSEYFHVDTTTYLYAPYTGTYILTIQSANDQVVGWVGATAYSGWTNSNYAVAATFESGVRHSIRMDLVAGTYTPIRVIWTQISGTASFHFIVNDPNHNIIAGNSNTPTDPLLVRFSCDGTAPAFPAWGSET